MSRHAKRKILDLISGMACAAWANCKAEMDDIGAGISDLDDAIRIEPKNASYYKLRGNFYYQLNETDKACFDWRKAVEFGDSKARFQIDQYCKKK